MRVWLPISVFANEASTRLYCLGQSALRGRCSHIRWASSIQAACYSRRCIWITRRGHAGRTIAGLFSNGITWRWRLFLMLRQPRSGDYIIRCTGSASVSRSNESACGLSGRRFGESSPFDCWRSDGAVRDVLLPVTCESGRKNESRRTCGIPAVLGGGRLLPTHSTAPWRRFVADDRGAVLLRTGRSRLGANAPLHGACDRVLRTGARLHHRLFCIRNV